MDAKDELIVRLNRATGPDRMLERDVAEVAGTYSAPDRGDPEGQWPHYTSSIDAALTLVPDGNLERMTIIARGESYVRIAGWGTWHRIPAIALCIAALKRNDSAGGPGDA